MARSKGSGSVYQRADGKWVAQVEDGWTASGKRRYSRRVRPNRKQATAALGELERIKQRGLDRTVSEQTLATYLDGWLDGLDGFRAPKTITAYRSDMAHAKAVIGQVRLRHLTPAHVRQLLQALPERGLAPKSALNVRTTLHTAVQQAVADRVLDWNPVGAVARPKVDRDEAPSLTVLEARNVLEALAGHRLYALYAVAVALGLRLGEGLGLTWDLVDLDAGTLKVRKQLQRIGDAGDRHYLVRDLKTRRSRRDIPLPAFAADALREHRKAQVAERLEAGTAWVDGCCHGCGWTGAGLVFVTGRSARRTVGPIGRPIHPTVALKTYQAVAEPVVGRRPTVHELRHTAASLLLAQRVPLAEVQQILGHSSIVVTRDVYGHLESEHLRAATDAMDGVLGERRSK